MTGEPFHLAFCLHSEHPNIVAQISHSFRMLYNYDPILPFEYVDKLEQGLLSDEEVDYQGDLESDAGSEVSGTTTDPIMSKIEHLENQHAS